MAEMSVNLAKKMIPGTARGLLWPAAPPVGGPPNQTLKRLEANDVSHYYPPSPRWLPDSPSARAPWTRPSAPGPSRQTKTAPSLRLGIRRSTCPSPGMASRSWPSCPGVKPEDVKLSLENNMLTIRGEKKQEAEDGHGRVHRYERSYGAFERAFVLPSTVDGEKISGRLPGWRADGPRAEDGAGTPPGDPGEGWMTVWAVRRSVGQSVSS